MIEPLPCDEPVKNINRLHQRQNIIHELDLIKARVDQVLYIVQLHIWQYTHFDDCIACYIYMYNSKIAVIYIIYVCVYICAIIYTYIATYMHTYM